MSGEDERMHILEMIESGQIGAEDGLRLLESLNGKQEAAQEIAEGALEEIPEASISLEDESAAPAEQAPVVEIFPQAGPEATASSAADVQPESAFPADVQKWRQWWMIPMWIGVAVTVSGGFLMYWAQKNSGFGLGFICAGVPFLIGVVVLALAWQSRSAPWLHLRVQQKPGERPQRIAISFPLPVRPAAWFFRTFGDRIPQLEGTSLDDVIEAVGESTSPDNPIYIQVDEGDEGEKVEIFIG